MELHHITETHDAGKAYVEFLRTADLSAGVYRLQAGAVDAQQPHAEDEIYYVIAGRARFRGGSREVAVAPGDVLFIPAGEPHNFLEIQEALQLLVFFAPAEGSRKQR